MSWHSGRFGDTIGQLLVFGAKLLLIGGGSFGLGALFLAIFFPGTFRQVFGTS